MLVFIFKGFFLQLPLSFSYVNHQVWEFDTWLHLRLAWSHWYRPDLKKKTFVDFVRPIWCFCIIFLQTEVIRNQPVVIEDAVNADDFPPFFDFADCADLYCLYLFVSGCEVGPIASIFPQSVSYSYIVFGRHGCVSIITWGIESCLWHFGSRLSQTGLNILFFERSVHWGETQSVLSGVSDSELRGDSECRGVTSVLHPPLLPPSLWPIWVSMWQLSLRSPLWRLRHGWTSRPTSSSRWGAYVGHRCMASFKAPSMDVAWRSYSAYTAQLSLDEARQHAAWCQQVSWHHRTYISSWTRSLASSIWLLFGRALLGLLFQLLSRLTARSLASILTAASRTLYSGDS